MKIEQRSGIYDSGLFSFFAGMTEIKAKNHASQRALRKLCHLKTETRVIDHRFVEPIFADKIEK